MVSRKARLTLSSNTSTGPHSFTDLKCNFSKCFQFCKDDVENHVAKLALTNLLFVSISSSKYKAFTENGYNLFERRFRSPDLPEIIGAMNFRTSFTKGILWSKYKKKFQSQKITSF